MKVQERKKRSQSRRLGFERLEIRRLLAVDNFVAFAGDLDEAYNLILPQASLPVDLAPFHNSYGLREDVNNDGVVTPLDATTLINVLDGRPSFDLVYPRDFSEFPSGNFTDVTGDGKVTSQDVLQVIGVLRSGHATKVDHEPEAFSFSREVGVSRPEEHFDEAIDSWKYDGLARIDVSGSMIGFTKEQEAEIASKAIVGIFSGYDDERNFMAMTDPGYAAESSAKLEFSGFGQISFDVEISTQADYASWEVGDGRRDVTSQLNRSTVSGHVELSGHYSVAITVTSGVSEVPFEYQLANGEDVYRFSQLDDTGNEVSIVIIADEIVTQDLDGDASSDGYMRHYVEGFTPMMTRFHQAKSSVDTTFVGVGELEGYAKAEYVGVVADRSGIDGTRANEQFATASAGRDISEQERLRFGGGANVSAYVNGAPWSFDGDHGTLDLSSSTESRKLVLGESMQPVYEELHDLAIRALYGDFL